ncbi:putative sterol o-acyltransferase [Diplodia seriata]|uniref:O-acyltransferase n=1 Tax=Diplodia seriata TaxID=420778 RepID=A0A0G2GYP2_9PEZI|nr:putative sterol o-acyltransferase [Diplodia seriata]
MSTTTSFEPAAANGDAMPELAQPRARKPENPHGRSTPVPPDAPPSVHATSTARKQIRAEQKRRIFPTIDYAARVSHFDPQSEYRDFRGFFVLFWVGLAIMVLSNMVGHYKETGYPLSIRQWNTFTANIWEMGLSDLIMCASTAISLPLHKLYDGGAPDMRWGKNGMLIQSIYQGVWMTFWTLWPFLRGWTWTAQVFFILHYLVMYMKMHSYAFYNGHLSETRHRLKELDHPETASMAAARKYPTAQTHLNQLTPEDEKEDALRGNDDSLAHLRDDLARELVSPLGNVAYPKNLTLANYIDYLFCPTLCYELEYPRTDRIRKSELAYKTLAVFGCIFLLTFITEAYVMPSLDIAAAELELPGSFGGRTTIVLETISRLLFPFTAIFLLVFLVIFEYALGAFAEMTCFADRHFYSDWWNSCDWLEFSREWNVPVHRFLRRHVYSASRHKFSRSTATVITFLISAAAHELVMGCITKKLRGYGAFAMMLQIPIVAVQRSKPVRGRTLLNNVLFWCSMVLGLSMMCALYVLV